MLARVRGWTGKTTGIEAATGDLIVFQDADLEYDPEDLAKLVAPFLEDGADVVYGSRFLSADRRRVLYFRHTLGNRLITFMSNGATDLNLTDVETCYKMVRGPLLKSIPIRSNDFRMEIELTAKEFALLELLLRHQGEVLPRSLIASQVWDMNFDSDTNVIDVAIRRLRAKVDENFEPRLIHTLRGMGYMLDLPEEE